MAKSKKYYVVWEGHDPGIYDSWAKCQIQIKNYSGARYKSFKSKDEAETAFYSDSKDYIGNKAPKKAAASRGALSKFPIVWESIAVDAACSGNPGLMEYRGVDTKSGLEFFRQGPFQHGTNNVGEFLALVHGLAHLKRAGSDLPIYSDSRTAISWVRKKHPNTKLKRIHANAHLFELMERAVKWLKTNTYETKIMKWETKEWGEIPADFGRK
jgi:ribonuclease HI